MDYRDLHEVGKDGKRKASKESRNTDRAWWRLKGDACAASIRSTIDFLQKNQQPRIRQQVISARLYGNVAMSGAAGATYARLLQANQAVKDRVTDNEVQSIIDTLVARVGENKPRPYWLTSGGNYREQRKAKKLNQWCDGVFYENHTFDIGLDAFRDAAIWGDGFIHAFVRGGMVRHERVMPSEIWVDEVEAQYGFPRRMHRVKTVDREELISFFPECREDIEKASRSTDAQHSSVPNAADMVTVAESWNLGTRGEDGEMVPGHHAITLVSGGTMLVEPEDWPFDFFPFARIPWCRRPLGYWSQGLAEQLQGDQLELNKNLWFIQRSMHLAGTFKILVKNGSKISKESLNNEIGAVINWTGEKPEYVIPPPIHEVYFTNVEKIRDRMKSRSGVSEMSAASRKPAGLNSGAAIREFEDVESDRHRTISRLNDNLYLELSYLSARIASDAASNGKLAKVRVPGVRNLTFIDFKKDVGNIDLDSLVLQCYPVSRLPRDPAGRLQTIQEYIQAGFMDPRQGRRALDFPDLDAIESAFSAAEECIEMTLDAIVDDGEFSPPEPTDDLTLAKSRVVEYINRYRVADLELERLNLLHRYSLVIDELQQQAMPPPQLGPGAPGGAPGGPQAAAAPPPVSDLIPNTPGATH